MKHCSKKLCLLPFCCIHKNDKRFAAYSRMFKSDNLCISNWEFSFTGGQMEIKLFMKEYVFCYIYRYNLLYLSQMCIINCEKTDLFSKKTK